MIYRNKFGTTSFPFVSSVPFSEGLIGDIKLVLKNSDKVPFVSAIAGGPQFFSIELQTEDTYLGSFSYTGNNWITLNNQNVFGFVYLNTKPQAAFSFTGRWELERSCYSYAVVLEGLQGAAAQGLSVTDSQTFDLRLGGDMTEREGSDSSVINIGREKAKEGDYETFSEYTQDISNEEPYISSINGIVTGILNISSSDSSVFVEPPVKVGDRNTYNMYIYTTENFPHCPEWDESSDSSI